MAGPKSLRATRLGSAEKENQPPKKAKRTVTVSDLFKAKSHSRPRRDQESSDVPAPKAAGISKRISSKSRSSAQTNKPQRAQDHPIFRDFTDATKSYLQGVSASRTHQLKPVYDELIARVDGLAVNGQPLDTAGVPIAEANAFAQHDSELSRPLEDETMTIQTTGKKVTHGRRLVRLGDTMRSFETLLEQLQPELINLLEELRELDTGIIAAKEDILTTEYTDVKKARRELNVTLESLAQEALDAKGQTWEDIKQARKDEQAARTEEKRKIAEFMKSLS